MSTFQARSRASLPPIFRSGLSSYPHSSQKEVVAPFHVPFASESSWRRAFGRLWESKAVASGRRWRSHDGSVRGASWESARK